MFALNIMRRMWRAIRHFKPIGIRQCGRDSYILRPRRIDGPQNIYIGKGTIVHKHSWLCTISEYAGQVFHPRLEIGNNVYIGQYACIVATQTMSIEDGCVLSEYVYIADNGHGISPDAGLIMSQPLTTKATVRLGAHCFVGYRACILPGVELGNWCIVGANSVVTKSFPDYSMVAGIPAKLIKRYSQRDRRWLPIGRSCAEYLG